MKAVPGKFILALILLTGGFGLVFLLGNHLERSRVNLPAGYEDSDLAFQGKRLKGFVLGADGLLADWYWMQSLQYLGEKISKVEGDFVNIERLDKLNPRLLYPYLDTATEFDPHFMPAYSFGATVLPAIDPEKAIALTEKGIASNPDQFRLYQYLGYIYWKLGRYAEAAEVYKRGSALPDAPPFMRLMAAAMTSEAGSPETARAMYRQMYESAEDQQTRNNAEFRLMEFDSKEELAAIRNVLAAYKDKRGSCPSSLGEVLPLLAAVKLPNGKEFRIDGAGNLVDASGVPYAYDAQACQAFVNPQRGRPVRDSN